MKLRKGLFKKYFILQLLIIAIFVISGFTEFGDGEEFQVNIYISLDQECPAVAMDKKGNFVITWMSDGQDGSEYGIFAQKFDKEGLAIGPEFQVNTYTESYQRYPAVAMDKKGNFVITWESLGQDGSEFGIFAQKFDKEGLAIGPEFQVNTHTESGQRFPAVAMDKKGNFVITWESLGQDGDGPGIFAQRFDKEGLAIGPEFQVNTYTESDQTFPAVAMDKKGRFVITWQSWNQVGSGLEVFAQRFDKGGLVIGPEFQVNSYTEIAQYDPAIAMDKKGKFVITWESYGQDGPDNGIFAQRFKKNGKAGGSEFQVNTHTESDQECPAVAMDKKGNFVITWESYGQDGPDNGIFAQRFKKNGKAIGSEFQVNTYTFGNQSLPAVAMDWNGNFVITWQSNGQDGSHYGVYAKMFKK
jgi:hypothetical protein